MTRQQRKTKGNNTTCDNQPEQREDDKTTEVIRATRGQDGGTPRRYDNRGEATHNNQLAQQEDERAGQDDTMTDARQM
jgi:hypothetical protein